jgi:hypothetical protein
MKYHRQSSFRSVITLFLLVSLLLPIDVVIVVLADDVDYNICVDRLEQEYNVFQGVSYASLALTFFNIVISRLCLAKLFARNAQFAYKYHFGMASIKLLFGILLLTVFWPSCPMGCGEGTGGGGGGGGFCQVDTHFYLYPAIVMAVGLNWMFRGYKYYKKMKDQVYNSVQAAAARAESSPCSDVELEDTREQEGEDSIAIAKTIDHQQQGTLSKAGATRNEGIV